MRIWDVPPAILCRNHLLGEHRELHAVWSILTRGRKGYSQHPETKRWVGKLSALYLRHEDLVAEMIKRGYRHTSPLNKQLATGQDNQDTFINSIPEQREILRNKMCGCGV
jgi:hypothetical protein